MRETQSVMISRGGEQAGGVPEIQCGFWVLDCGLVGPAEGGHRPEAGAEPGVEDVGVLFAAAVFKGFDHFAIVVIAQAARRM